MRTSAVLVSGMAGLAAALAPLRQLDDFSTMERFLQKHYKELTPPEMQKVLNRITREVEKQYGVRPEVRDYKPMDGLNMSIASI